MCLCSLVTFLMCLFVFSGEVSDVFVCVQW